MTRIEIPNNITLPEFTIPIFDNKTGLKVGVAVQTKINSGVFSFKPKLKGKYSRNNYDFELEYEPCLKDNKIESISLTVKYTI